LLHGFCIFEPAFSFFKVSDLVTLNVPPVSPAKNPKNYRTPRRATRDPGSRDAFVILAMILEGETEGANHEGHEEHEGKNSLKRRNW